MSSQPKMELPSDTLTKSTTEEELSESKSYLAGLINRTLHVHITDGRMFVGQMKCTDRERNIILAMTHEYRHPPRREIDRTAEIHSLLGSSGNFRIDMLKRFVGLIVVPGQHITKIELEQFA